MTAASVRQGRAYSGVACPLCSRPLEHASLVSGLQNCPYCGHGFEAAVFHPVERRARLAELAAAGPVAGTSCGNHERNAAAIACGRCGMFVCTLCQIDADRLSLCPACFDRMKAEGSLPSVRNRFRDFRGLAIVSAGMGILIVFVAPAFGAAAIYYGVRARRQKNEMGESDGRVGIWFAIAGGSLEIVAGAWFLVRVYAEMFS